MMVDQPLAHASAIRACKGEQLSGDAVVIQAFDQDLFVAIVDVLGHGPEANKLTHVIEAYLARYAGPDVKGVMKRLHQHLNGTRGAAIGLCYVSGSTGRLDYAGIGNTTLRRFGQEETRLVSQDGVLGQNMRTPLLQTLRLEPGDLVLLYTDGVSDRFAAGDYPSLLRHAPSAVVKNIVERFGKDHDDAGCIALRYLA